MKQIQSYFYIFTLLFLTACGGGDPIGGGDNENPGDGTTPDPTPVISVELSIDNPDIDSNSPATIHALVTEDGSPLSGKVVTFSTDLGVFSIESGTALTNSDGVATIGLTAGTIEGAGTVQGTIDSGESGSVSFQTAGDATDPGTSPGGLQINMSISSTNVTASTPATITAQLVDFDGPVAGSVVTFATDLGFLAPISGTALTDSGGNASIQINAGEIQGAGSVTATVASGETGTISFASAGDGGSVAGKQIVLALSSIDVSASSPVIATVKVTDENGPVSAEVVNFSSSLGVINPASGTALTNALGEASITLTAGDVAGAGLITASLASGEFDSTGFATAGDASMVAGKNVTISISSNDIRDASPALLTAIVTDAGVPVAGEVVNFASTLGSLAPISGTALTNAAGEASIVLTAGMSAGAGVASVTLDNGASAKVGFETAGDETIDAGKTVSVSLSTTNISAETPATVTVLVTDQDGVVAGEVVNFSSSLGVLKPVSGTALTESNGMAVITLTAGSLEGAGILTASLASGEFDSVGFATKGDASEISGKNVVININNSSVSDAAPALLTATVTEAGNPVAGEVVNFSATLGSLYPASGTALTNSSGIATITLNAGQTAGAGVASATLENNATATVGFETAGDEPIDSGKTISVFLSNDEVSFALPVTVTTNVSDSNGPISGEVVTFSSNLGEFSPMSGTALTDVDGNATITLLAGSTAGADVLTAALNSGEQDTVGFKTLGDTPVVVGKEVAIVIDNVNVSDANPATLTATVTEGGNPIAGEVVTFTSTLGSLSPVSGSALTDSNGVATIILNAGMQAGAGIATATLSNGSAAEVGFATAGDEPVSSGKMIIVNMSSNKVKDSEPVTVLATVTNANGPVANEVVEFSASLGVFDPVSGSALTDGDGVATILLNAGSEQGAAVLTASLSSGEFDSIGFETAGDTPVVVSKVVTIAIDSPSIDDATPATLTATVTEGGNPVSGEVVNFASTLGSLSPQSGTALTNGSGVATITLNAGMTAGAGVATATLNNGATANVGFETAGDESLDSGKTVVLTLSSNMVNDANPVMVTATVTDANGAVAYEVVNFSSTIGVITPVSGSALTDENGQAIITLNAGSVEGAGILSASLTSGEIATVGFATAGDTPIVIGKVISISIDDTMVGEGNPATLTATVTESGSVVSGEVVNFAATLGSLSPQSGTALTDNSGIATITLNAGLIAGAGVATATLDNGATANVSFETAGDESIGSGKIITISSITNTVDNQNPLMLSVFVEDEGLPVESELVTFTTQNGLGAFDPAFGTALTDNTGNATITLLAGTVKGADLVIASLSSGERDTLGFTTEGDAASGVSVELELIEKDSFTEIQLINSTTPGRMMATVSGVTEPVIVRFTALDGLGVIPIGSAVTDENNQAFVDIFAGDTLGAGTIEAVIDSTGDSDEEIIVVGATNLFMGSQSIDVLSDPQIGVGEADLSVSGDLDAGSTMNVSVLIVDDTNTPYTQPIDVEFTSNCVVASTSIMSSPVSTINGIANSTYRADGCEGVDDIVVSAIVGGKNLTANATVTVKAAATGSIEFLDAEPEQISLKGTGNTESSKVRFKVLDINGNPVSNELVGFTLNTDVGGITLDPKEAYTDQDGIVQSTINSGNIATSVRVTAQIQSNNLSTQSSNLVITTGIPDQNSFTITTEKVNMEAWRYAGETSEIKVYLADAFNNPAPDGTAVTFTTEGGSVVSECTTDGGQCLVTFTSQNPYPEDGRITLLATAIGEESFIDLNGNGLYDNDQTDSAKEVMTFEALANDPEVNISEQWDLPEAYLDKNEDNQYDPTLPDAESEIYIDFDKSGDYTDADLVYTGSLCTNPSDFTTCSAKNSLNVRGDVLLIMSDSFALFNQITDIDSINASVIATDRQIIIKGEEIGGAVVNLSDLKGQPMPENTIVNFIAEGAGSIITPMPYTWPRDSQAGGKNFPVSIKGEDVDEITYGQLIIEVTTPKGNITRETLDIVIEP